MVQCSVILLSQIVAAGQSAVVADPKPEPAPKQTTKVAFLVPAGMKIAYDAGGHGKLDSKPLTAPVTQDFESGAIYRLGLSDIPGRPGVELNPAVEVAPVVPRTATFLARNPIPVQFRDEDLDQVLAGNFVTKVIYVPDDEFQDLPPDSVEELVSTRLDPGVDPVVEADRRGTILAIVRLSAENPLAVVPPDSVGWKLIDQSPSTSPKVVSTSAEEKRAVGKRRRFRRWRR